MCFEEIYQLHDSTEHSTTVPQSMTHTSAWTQIQLIDPEIGGFNGYDGPTGNDSSGSNASDNRPPEPEELELLFGNVE